ncbi:hypothetical protein F2Q69_00029237 [Brassica cretica]|uniref:SWIM-type domain-containing protein n=1 Tax=Brassica cretica TaxID=69181 RepID=A0A8S9S7B3_BRACR|nr:hypothetical protein F2Q69_00029237 [Brassica cretica]
MLMDHGCEITKSLAWDAREYAVNAVRDVEKKIERRTEKGKRFAVYPVSDGRLLVRGDKIDCLVDLDRRTCSCGKYNLMKIPCRHAIKAGFHVGRQPHTLTDLFYTTEAWREAYHESINPIAVPEDAWSMPEDVVVVNVLPPESRKSASKVYRVAEFEKIFANVCNISPAIGKYLRDAEVQKWARCQFSGYRYDIRTTNPAESINSALRSPREYPIIPLLDSIREMLTRWFYNRKKKISKHNHPLTIDVEKKIERRTEKGKRFAVYPVSDEAWREAYHESINPIAVPEEAWSMPEDVVVVNVLPPESRKSVGLFKYASCGV